MITRLDKLGRMMTSFPRKKNYSRSGKRNGTRQALVGACITWAGGGDG